MGNRIVIKSINMERLGGSGSIEYPVTILKPGAYTNKQVIGSKTGGYGGRVSKLKVVYNEGGYVASKSKKGKK